MLLSPKKLLAFKGGFLVFAVVGAMVAGGFLVARPAQAGFFSSFIKFFSGASGETEEGGLTIIRSTNAEIDASALTADGHPDFFGEDATSEDPLNIVQDHALVASLNPVGTMAASDASPGRIFIYTVRSGDTLSSIARTFDVSVNTIRWANNLAASKSVSIGAELVILPVSGVRHTVKKSDTIASIAKQYRTSIEDIIGFNGFAPDEELLLGSTIMVPDGELAESKPLASGASALSSSGLPSYAGYYLRPIVGGRKSRGIHGFNGIDLANSCGLPVYASAGGTVLISKTTGWNGGYGEYVVIAHANGTQTLYGHLSVVSVVAGSSVVQGAPIGLIGSTGNSTGCHVHFEVRGAKNPF